MQSVEEIKKYFLEDLGPEETSKLDELAFAVIDQVIENIEEGQATVEGRKPETRKEYFMLIAYCAEDAKKQLIEIARKGAIPNGEVQEIAVNFRERKFKIKVRGINPTNAT